MWRAATWNTWNTLSRLAANMRRHSSSDRSTNDRRPPPPIPALAKHASTRPNSASAALNVASTAARSLTSQTRASTAPPWARSCDRARSFFSGLRPQIDTAHPARASASAMPSPMPPLPPVTIATRPARSKSLTCFGLPNFPGAIEHIGPMRCKRGRCPCMSRGRGSRRARAGAICRPGRLAGWGETRQTAGAAGRMKAEQGEESLRKLVIAAALVLALAGELHAQESIKIGLILPLTGNAASAGQQSKAAVELGAEIVNNAHPELGALPLAAGAGLPNLHGAKLEIILA